MVISLMQGIILHIIIVASWLPQLLWCFQRHLMFYTYNYNIQGNS